jgi:hypothetical protein
MDLPLLPPPGTRLTIPDGSGWCIESVSLDCVGTVWRVYLYVHKLIANEAALAGLLTQTDSATTIREDVSSTTVAALTRATASYLYSIGGGLADRICRDLQALEKAKRLKAVVAKLVNHNDVASAASSDADETPK